MSKLRQLVEAANRKCEMAWKVYSYNPEKDNELVDTSKAFDCIAAAQAHKRDILEKNPNYTVEIIAESSQKNEAIFKPGDKVKVDFNWRGIKPSIKEVVILNKRHLGSKDFDEDEYEVKLQNGKTMWVNTQAITEAANIDVKNPGVLEVPDGKKVDELPQSHFEKLVDKKGYAEVIRALTNLEVWNKDKNKSLSSWASNMADKLKKKFRPESAQKNEDLSKHPKLKEIWSRWKFNTKYGLHYTSNAKDTQAYLAKITKPNTFWLEDEDTGKVIVQGTPKDLINFMLNHKNTIDESAQKSESKVNMPKLKNEIQAAVNKYFKNDKDLLEYVHIDTKKDKLGRDILEVRAELGYNDMVKLADHLDKIVTKYDRYAYFDQETSGIMTAVFESSQKNESLRDLNLELADDTNAIAASADKIRQRFEYRTLQNQSYDEKQAEKIYLEVRRELEKAKKMIDACYNKIG